MRATLLVTLLATATLGAQTATAPPGTTNYTRVNATVACAGATTTEAIPAIKADGFKAIVNLRQASEEGAEVEASKQAATAAGLKYFHIPVTVAELKPATVDAFLAALKDPANSPVFIHCASANRAGMMWMIKRVMLDGWTVDKAAAEAELAGMKNPKLKALAMDYLKAHGKA
jgi:uncharacterized protein (TIGR01244 family)